MKYYSATLLLSFILLLIIPVKAQFKLSGKISNFKGSEAISVNIPQVYGYNREENLVIPVKSDGSFSVNIPINEWKFADIICQKVAYTVFMSPKNSLILDINSKDSTLKAIGGTLVIENQLILKIAFAEGPSFYKYSQADYDSLNTLALIKDKIVSPTIALSEEKMKLVNSSKLPKDLKALLLGELKYNTSNQLSELRYYIKDKALANEYYDYLYNTAQPKPEYYPVGRAYYQFARNYLGYLDRKAIVIHQQNRGNNSDPLPFYGISIDSGTAIVTKVGKSYLRWILANNIFPDPITERLTYKEIVSLYLDKDLRLLEPLVKAYSEKFKTGESVIDAKERLARLNAEKVENSKNQNIQILANYDKVNSIYEAIKSFKGKVVYLDVWGTWCGPCKEELKFVPELKTRFKNKDVAFVYLDLDDDSVDASWREFIVANNMEGLHLRKTRQTIIPFWKELLADAADKAEYYPQYFIFDKNGKLVVSKAERPSTKEKLYKQIEKYLN